MSNKLEIFNNFLESLDLEKYRDKYKSIKTMEADMSKNIQALESIYKVYWNKDESKNIDFPNFDDFYCKYYLSHEMITKVTEFNKNRIGLCEDCLMKGLEARIYRTWASLITQIQAAYCCAEIFGIENIDQSVHLDHLGIDIKVTYKNIKIGIQIKKETGRKEIANRKPEPRKQKEISKIYDIYYKVLKQEEFDNPRYKVNGKNHNVGDFKPYAYLFGFNDNEPFLTRLSNGFVIFTKKYFKVIKEDIDNNAKID